MEVKSKEIVLLLDGDFLLYYATMGNKVLDEQGNPVREDNKFVYTNKTFEEVTRAADDIINNILDKADASYYIGYIGNSKSFRYDVYPEYKANRKNFSKPEWFKELKAYLKDEWKFTLLDNGLEADDAVNIARNLLKKDYSVIITTNDKDLIKCIPGKYINPKDLSIIRTSKEKAYEAFWTSMITGDNVDNIKGIPKCGKAFAEKLFRDKNYEDFSDIVALSYRDKFGEEGDYEFTKNYKLLYILDTFEGFEVELILRKEEPLGKISTSRDCAEESPKLW